MLGEIVRTRQRCVHNSLPLLRRSFLDLELQLFPVRVDHHVDIVITLRNAVQAERQAARIVGQIDLAGPVPGDVLPPESAAAQGGMTLSGTQSCS